MRTKTFKRVTFSFPQATLIKLEQNIPKNGRSKFVADLIEKNLKEREMLTLEDVQEFWNNMRKKYKRTTDKTAVELVREDRLSH